MKFEVFVLFLLPAIILAQDDGGRVIPSSKFTVIAPYTIRQGKPYNIYVRGFSIIRSILVTITLKGTSDAGVDVNIEKIARLTFDNQKVSLSIDTSAITAGSYSLYIQGGSVDEKRMLTFISKKSTFLIFMNKAIFLAGDLVRYKVLVVDSETRAVNPSCSSTTSILDPKGNYIISSLNNKYTNGRHEGSLQLSNKTSLGMWKLQVKCGDEIITKAFKVDEYVLPIVDAKLIVDPVIPYNLGRFPVTIEASYTFGRATSVVTGKALLTFSDKNGEVFKVNVNVDGTGTFVVDIAKGLKVKPDEFGNFDISMIFNDPLSGTKVTDIKSIKIVPKTYTIHKKVLTPFKPGGPYEFILYLKKYDGSPAPAGTNINIMVEEPNGVRSQILQTDAQGSAKCTINVPSKTNLLYIKCKSKDAWDGIISESIDENSNIGPNLDVQILTQNPKIYEAVKIIIRSSEQIQAVMLHIVAKGILLKSTKVYFNENGDEPNTAYYEFRPSTRYIPEAKIIVYYIDKDGNVIYGTFNVEISAGLPNYLKVIPDKSTVKPGSKVNFMVESYLDSTVSLVAVDQRSLLLRGGNNIVKSDVFGDLQQYNKNAAILDWENIAAYEYIFALQGLFIATNVPRPPPPPYVPPSYYIKHDIPFSTSSTGFNDNDIKIREDFREYFLWLDVDVLDSANDPTDDTKGLASVSEKVPESITTYVIQGVSMNEYYGIGLPEESSSISVFLPFFVNIDLPYSLKHNEVLIQDIVLFNFLKQAQTVDVQIRKNNRFLGVDLANYGWKETTTFYVQTVKTKVGQHVKLQFAIQPTVSIGFITLDVTAKGLLAGDGLKKQLRIVFGGILRTITKSIFIYTQGTLVQSSLTCTLPDSAFPDTTDVSATVTGDIFAKALQNLDKLISMPGGCGEQTMLTLAPDISIYIYLKSSGKMTPSLQAKLEQFILAGYQNELNFQRTVDRSFSAYGDKDAAGSTWLTAFVLKYFYIARSIIAIDPNVIQDAANFIAGKQAPNGQFLEDGKVLMSYMQGGSGQGPAMTAYIAIVFTTILPDYPKYKPARDAAITFLEGSFSASSSTYELAVIAYALELAKSAKAKDAFNLFDSRKYEDNNLIFWTASTPPITGLDFKIASLDIEITSYGLLLYVSKYFSFNLDIKIAKFLVNNVNSFGGYFSSQDTVMAFEALSKMGIYFSINTNLQINLKPQFGTSVNALLYSANFFEIQSFSLDPKVTNLIIGTEGEGMAIISLICNFYDDPTKVVPSFEVTSTFGNSCVDRIELDVCVRYTPTPGYSKMTIMTVNMPSGFTFNEWASTVNPQIMQREVTNEGSTVTFYFYLIDNTQICANIKAFRTNIVNNLQGGTIVVNDYYDTSKEAIASYNIPANLPPC